MNSKFVPLIILGIFAIGTWWMIQSMDNLVKTTQPTDKTQSK